MTEFTGDQERLIRMALEHLRISCEEELREIPHDIKLLQEREEELMKRKEEISSMLYLDFGC